MWPDRWVTLQDVYRCTLDPERIERKMAEVAALVERPSAMCIASDEVSGKMADLAAWSWKRASEGVVHTAYITAQRK